jgi:multidrug efflux system outer membrane protein
MSARLQLCALLCVSVLMTGCSITPEPLTNDQFEHIAVNDREMIFEAQEPIPRELTVDLAMSMALKYNLENRVRLLEESVANQQLDMTKQDLLPTLAANAGFTDRDNVNASTSVSLETGNVSLEPSTSQDRDQFNASGRLTWNVLDFGVSYLQAKQDADRFLITQKAREKVMLSLLKEVRAAYWKAVAMEQMRGDLDRISQEVDELLVYWQTIREQQLRAPVAVLMDIRALVETRQQLDEIRRNIDTSRAKLANLINAESFSDLPLPVEIEFPEMVAVSDDLDRMELVALAHSADYASEVYKVRIEQLESRKTMLRLLPGIEFSYGANYDDNSFVKNNHWGEFGANLTGDITRLLFTKQIKKFRESNEQLTITRRLAINMAVITGVHITWQDYKNALTEFKRADYLQEIDEEISLLTRNAQLNQSETGAAAIQTELKAFRSKISQLQSYAGAQEALGSFLVSIGVNPIPDNYQQYSVEELAAKLATNFAERSYPFTKEGEEMLSKSKRFNPVVSDELLTPLDEIELDQPEPALALLEKEDEESDLSAVVLEKVASSVAPTNDSPETLLSEVQQQLELTSRSTNSRTITALTSAPDSNEFLKDLWKKYFPEPDMNAYLKAFIEKMPEGPGRDVYLQLLLKRTESSPDHGRYLQEFRHLLRQ